MSLQPRPGGQQAVLCREEAEGWEEDTCHWGEGGGEGGLENRVEDPAPPGAGTASLQPGSGRKCAGAEADRAWCSLSPELAGDAGQVVTEMQGCTRQPEAGTGWSQSLRAGKDQGSESKEEVWTNKTKRQTPRLQPTPTPSRAGAGTAWDPSLLGWAGLASRMAQAVAEADGARRGPDPRPTREWLGLSVRWSPPTAPTLNLPPLGAWLGKGVGEEATFQSQCLHLLLLPLALFPCQWHALPAPMHCQLPGWLWQRLRCVCVCCWGGRGRGGREP